jgi:hypothetical protein
MLIKKLGLDGVLVDADKKVILTKNIRKDIEILNDSYQLKE